MLKKNSLVVVGVALAAMVMVAGCQQRRTTKGPAALKTVYFDFDKSDIRSDQKSVMEGNANWIKGHSKKVGIAGHCDERGTNEYNVALGQRRANGAKKYLVSLGVADGSLSTVSHGEEKPTCTQSTEACWAKNRRDEFTAK